MLAASLHFVNITLHFPKLQGEVAIFDPFDNGVTFIFLRANRAEAVQLFQQARSTSAPSSAAAPALAHWSRCPQANGSAQLALDTRLGS
jgi:hypothetical protein